MPLTPPSIYVADHASLARAMRALPRRDLDASARYTAPRRRAQFLAARALTHLALERATGCAYGGIDIEIHDDRPRAAARPELGLSISHSATLVACALCATACGVDIQRKVDKPLIEIAEAFYTKEEHAALLSLEAGARADLFYRWWTLKEAWIKASGADLLPALARVRVARASDSATREWRGWSFSPDGDIAGALVMRARDAAAQASAYVWTGTAFETARFACEPVTLAVRDA